MMGAQLVGLVFAAYSHLPGTQFKVLTRMALGALDTPSARNPNKPVRVYTEGWEPLSMALGRRPQDELDRHRQLRHEVSKVCTQLRRLGAIEPTVGHPQLGMQQSWHVILAGSTHLLVPVDNPE